MFLGSAIHCSTAISQGGNQKRFLTMANLKSLDMGIYYEYSGQKHLDEVQLL